MPTESKKAEIIRKYHPFNSIDYPVGTRILYELKVDETSPINDCVIEATVEEWSPSFKAVRLANTGWHKVSSVLIIDKFPANKTHSLVPSETVWDGIYEAIKYAYPVSIRPHGIYFIAKCMHGGAFFICGKIQGNDEPVFECTYDPKTKTAYNFNVVKVSLKKKNSEIYIKDAVESLYGNNNFIIYNIERLNETERLLHCTVVKNPNSKLQEPESFTCKYSTETNSAYDLQCKYKY